MSRRKRLGEILQERGLITHEQLIEALKIQKKTGDKLGDVLVKIGYLSAEQIADALSAHLGIPRIDLSRTFISEEVFKLVPEAVLEKNEIIPVEIIDDELVVAMTDPLNIHTIDELQRYVRMFIRPVIATREEVSEAINRTRDISDTVRKVFDEYVSDDEDEVISDERLLGDAPGVKLANLILQQALQEKASDIHFEPREEDLRIRFRIDGLLRDVMVVPKRLRADVCSRVKVMANLDITERRRPQDGRIQMSINGSEVDMRVSTLPTVHGEKIVARLFNKSYEFLSIEKFGFSANSLNRIESMLHREQGLVLVTGPTGSGKSTTLYGFLNKLSTPERNIITVEDPVEYRLENITQVQVNPRVGLTFANGLRTVLRQDPDIIMVGEIRDKETADIAVRSALTGHLVLTTLHTNNAVASVIRLMDMEIEPYLISSTLVGVVAQRLVRKICSKCKEEVELTDQIVKRIMTSLNIPVPQYVYQGKGCPACKNSGYDGRLPLEEVLLVNKDFREAVSECLPETELYRIATESGMVPLEVNAISKLVAGETTVSEIVRTVYGVLDEEVLGELPK